jgi:hypothetical protein
MAPIATPPKDDTEELSPYALFLKKNASPNVDLIVSTSPIEVYMYKYIYICICLCMYIYVCIYVYTYTYICQ